MIYSPIIARYDISSNSESCPRTKSRYSFFEAISDTPFICFFNSGDNGTILLEKQTKTNGKVIVTHVNAETEEVFKTETVYGIVGEIGTAELIDIEGYVFDHISGDIDTTDSTFEFSEEEKHVTLYYVFDSENYSYVELTFVDAATGEYIDDPEILISSKGTLYIEPKDIENYEADLDQSDGPEIYIGDDETVSVRFVYHRVESYIKVHYYNANGWTNVYMYAYVGDGPSAEKLLGPWPGKLMTYESEGWYVCEVPDRENERVIFASGLGPQEPGQARPGYLISGETWMKNGEPQSISKVNVLYVTDDSETLDTIVLSGLEGDEYNTTPINFEGYELVSNSDNTSGTFGSENITVTYTYKAIAPEEFVNTSELSSDNIKSGESFTVNASAQGGTGDYQYAVLYKLSTRSKWTTAQAYAANTPVSFTPAVDGAYDVCIKVKDADGTEEKLFLEFVVDDSFKNTSALSETTITVGSSVTVLCSAAGLGDTYLYAVSYKKSTDEGWTELQSLNSNSSVEFAPASSGSYSIYVEASDANGDIVGTVLELEVNDAAPLENKSFTDAAIYDLGVNVSIIGEAAGGTGGYKYMALYKLSTRSRWTTVQQYSDDDVMVFSPSSAGIYNICVKIKDSRGVEVKKFIDIEVVDNNLKNYSCISANKIESGENILVIANAAGSTGFYRYTVSYKKETAGKWIIKQDNKANQFVVIEPDETGVYDVCVKVTDNTGKSARKYFKVEVTEPQDALCNTSSVSETEIVLGEYVIVMASASGSTGFYQYSVYYKAESDDSWTSLSQYSPNGYVIFKPESAGNYEIFVNVKDDEESEETKIFNISVSDNNEICFYDN